MKWLSPKRKWIFFSIVVPLIPFFGGGFLRLLFTQKMSWNTFEGSEISICLTLFSFNIAQSLLSCDQILNNKDKEYERKNEIIKYFILGSFFLFVFTLNVILSSLTLDSHLTNFELPRYGVQIFTYFTLPVMVIISLRTQETYRLTASLL